MPYPIKASRKTKVLSLLCLVVQLAAFSACAMGILDPSLAGILTWTLIGNLFHTAFVFFAELDYDRKPEGES